MRGWTAGQGRWSDSPSATKVMAKRWRTELPAPSLLMIPALQVARDVDGLICHARLLAHSLFRYPSAWSFLRSPFSVEKSESEEPSPKRRPTDRPLPPWTEPHSANARGIVAIRWAPRQNVGARFGRSPRSLVRRLPPNGHSPPMVGAFSRGAPALLPCWRSTRQMKACSICGEDDWYRRASYINATTIGSDSGCSHSRRYARGARRD